MSGRLGLILDRDGVINHDCGYLHRIEECQFIYGIFALVRAFRAHGFVVAIATNQAGIGRGYYTEADFHCLMDWMLERFRLEDAPIDAVYYCPDHPTQGIGGYRKETSWRKPGPGMFLQAADDLSLDMSRSWAIGDKLSDVEAGRRAGVGTCVLLDSGTQQIAKMETHWTAPSHASIEKLLKTAFLEPLPESNAT